MEVDLERAEDRAEAAEAYVEYYLARFRSKEDQFELN